MGMEMGIPRMYLYLPIQEGGTSMTTEPAPSHFGCVRPATFLLFRKYR